MMASFFAGIKLFRFWPKTIDYNKAFCCVLYIAMYKLMELQQCRAFT